MGRASPALRGAAGSHLYQEKGDNDQAECSKSFHVQGLTL